MITKVFQIRVDYEPNNGKDIEKVTDLFFDRIKYFPHDEAESFSGNPACSPYLYAECSTKADAISIERAMLFCINKVQGEVKHIIIKE